MRSLLVRLTTDSGLEGWGEAGLAWRAGELAARRDALLPVLAGRSIFDIEELHTLEALRHVAPLRAAVEMACWDLIGRARRPARCAGCWAASIGGGSRWPCACRAAGPSAWPAWPGKWPPRASTARSSSRPGRWRLDRQLLQAVREGVGDRHGTPPGRPGPLRRRRPPGTSAATIEADDLQFLLDPLAVRELYPLAALGRQTRVPLAVGRAIAGAADVLAVVRCGAASFVVLDIEQRGRAGAARACAAVAAAAGIFALLGGRPPLGVATAAMLHLAAATPALSGCNESAYHQLQDDVLSEPLAIDERHDDRPAGAGLRRRGRSRRSSNDTRLRRESATLRNRKRSA